MLPTFLVIGAQKAGTTSLHAYLAQHPQVFVADKELNFFTDLEYDKGIGWYEEQFATAGDAVARGDVSPLYTAYPWQKNVPERVAQHLPGVKLIYLLRHPVERSLSNYRFHVALGLEAQPMEQALFEGNPVQYLTRGAYSLQIEQWLPHIDRRDLLVVTSEELRRDRPAAMRRIFTHIRVDPGVDVGELRAELNRTDRIRLDRGLVARLKRTPVWRGVRAGVPKPLRHEVWERVGSRRVNADLQEADMPDDLRRRVVAELRPDLERLPQYVGADFDCWGLLEDPLAR